MRLLLFLRCLASALALTTADLAGTWRQLYSNAYVQATAEIDWACVEVAVEVAAAPDGDGGLTVAKRARLHGGPLNVTTPALPAQLVDGHRLVFPHAATIVVHNLRGAPVPIKVDRVFDLHAYQPDTLVLTGANDPALMVWARGPKATEIPPQADIEAYVQNLGFRPDDPAYAKVLPSYNATACGSGGDDQDEDEVADVGHL